MNQTPSDFLNCPCQSIFFNYEHEVVAQNIMIILFRTGNAFRMLEWDEYKQHRLKDGDFSEEKEKFYFRRVVEHCSSEESAKSFSPFWRRRSV